jgi:CRISPR-associated protein Csb3
MTPSITFPGDRFVAFDHLVAYGAAAIAQNSGVQSIRLGWTDSVESRLDMFGIEWPDLATLVKRHATRHASPDSWVGADGEIRPELKADPKKRNTVQSALFSPRVTGMNDQGISHWRDLRAKALDGLSGPLDLLDFLMIGSLGEPSYWSENYGQRQQDYGASRWEMKTRNKGEEFVGNRLRKLAATVKSMPIANVEAGLRGDEIFDVAGKSAGDSRTPTGLKAPQATDNARAWCALWGLSVMSVTHHRNQNTASLTTGHTGRHSSGYFYLPVMIRPWPLARLQTVLRSCELSAVADADLPESQASAGDLLVSWNWLGARGVAEVIRFPVHRTNNANAPEKWIERGKALVRGVVR